MVDYNAINNEIANVRSQLAVSWADFADYCKAKMMEAAMNEGNVSSYSIGGRSVSRTEGHWRMMRDYALKQAAHEHGVPAYQSITFIPRESC